MNPDIKLNSEQRARAANSKLAADRAKELIDANAHHRQSTAEELCQPVADVFERLSDSCPGCSPDALLAAALELSSRE